MSKFGMGRGLADLQQQMGAMPDISILAGTERVVVKQIPLAQIGANPDQPRKTFSDAELSELADSIREKGVLQPILLRAVSGRDHMYEIVAGERRFRASKLAGLAEIPALVKTLTDENAMEVALIENVQRENLNPIEEGAAYQNLIDKCGYEIADVCRLIGKSESYIRNILRQASLPDDVKALIEQGAISASHARTIVVADDPSALAREIVAENLSVAETQKRAKNAKRSGNSRSFVNNSIDEQTVCNIEKRMGTVLGTTVRLVQRRGGAGQFVISFSNRIQMDELIEKIC